MTTNININRDVFENMKTEETYWLIKKTQGMLESLRFDSKEHVKGYIKLFKITLVDVPIPIAIDKDAYILFKGKQLYGKELEEEFK